MGQKSRPEEAHRMPLACNNCGTDYWTDQTQGNDCPECGFQDFEVREAVEA